MTLIPVWGDPEFRGDCPPESAEQITAINTIRKTSPQVIHPRNEGKRSYRQTARHKAEGLTKGASDIVIPGAPAFVCELKRKDKTKSRVSPEQVDYIKTCLDAGAVACIAYGHEAALSAYKDWLKIINKPLA